MTDTRAVAVVVVSYHTGPLLARCVGSVLAEPEVAELVVVDNGNPDEARAWLAAEASREPRLRVLSGHGNVGFARGCNLGVAATTSPHIFLLNPDAVVPRGTTGTLLAEGTGRGGNAPWVIGGRLLNADGTEQAGARRGPLTPWTALVEMARLDRLAPRHPYFVRFNRHETPCPGATCDMPVISGACMLMPRATYDLVGGMDEGFFLHVEDVDFCLRLAAAGGRVLYTPRAEIVHAKSSSRVSPLRVERWKAQSLNRYFRRHFTGMYPPGFVSLVGAVVWAGVGMRAAKTTLRGAKGLLGLGAKRGLAGPARAVRLARRRAGR